MKIKLFFLLILIQIQALAQLNCKTMKQADGSTVITCFHRNGKVSTLETWDKDKRFGTLKGYSNQGKELFSQSLRDFGGHAYAQMTYFPNGQVASIHFSDAPDGGIQFYNSDTRFDESGNQTIFSETKYPDRLEFKPVHVDTIKPRNKPLVEINQVLEKSVTKKRLLAVIENKSNKRVSLMVHFSDGKKEDVKTVELKSGESYLMDTQKLVPVDFDATKFISIDVLTRKCILQRQPDQLTDGEDEVLQATWFIIKK